MQFAWLLHSGMYSFSSRREIINQLKMPQRCILRCSVQPVHLYAKMLSWQKKASNLFSNWRIKFDISKSKSERESFKRIHFWLSFPIYQFYASMLLVSLYGLIRNVQHSGKERRRKEKHNTPPRPPPQLQPVLLISGVPNSQKLTAYVLFHMLLPKYDRSISSFIFFFPYTTRINFSIVNCIAIKE